MNTYPPKPIGINPLSKFWDKSVQELVSLPVPTLTNEEIERHQIYSYLLMSIVTHYWSGNKYGSVGSYPFRSEQQKSDGEYLGGNYLGHNIAALAVDNTTGKILDFDFNHNELFNSSVEHAESRLVRRIFSLAQLDKESNKLDSYGNILNDVTIYTSLESCSQCSGIMALGLVKEVVFLQRDPGQSSIGNILHSLNPSSPLPIPGDLINMFCFSDLAEAYKLFLDNQQPFYTSPSGKTEKSKSITSFLCSDAALDIFNEGKVIFDGWRITAYIANQNLIDHAHNFYEYAINDGRRGTPHRV